MDQVAEIARKTPGVDQVVTVAGISPLDNSASLANAGVAYVTLKPWSQRGKGQDLLSLFIGMNQAMQAGDGRARAGGAAAADPGHRQRVRLHHAARTARRQLRLHASCRALANAMVEAAQSQTGLQRVQTTFRSDAPQFRIDVDRVKAQTLHVNVDQVFSTIQTFMGSTYVVQFNKFGRTFQAYVQADAQFRLRPEDIAQLTVRNQQGQHRADRHARRGRADHRPAADQPLQPLSDGDGDGHAGAGLLVGPGDGADGADRGAHAAARHRLRMDRACRIRRRSSATRCTWCSASACCWSIWCSPDSTRAGTRRSRSCCRCRWRWSDRPRS